MEPKEVFELEHSCTLVQLSLLPKAGEASSGLNPEYCVPITHFKMQPPPIEIGSEDRKEESHWIRRHLALSHRMDYSTFG